MSARRRAQVALLAAVAAAIAVAGTSRAAAAIKTACDLITKTEMEMVLGVPMRNPEPQIMGMCEYKSVGNHPYKAVRLMMNRAESRDAWEKHERELDADVTPTAVPGVGDAALLWNRTLDARLALIKGKTTLTIVLDVGRLTPGLADTMPVAHRLAQIAAPRLP